MTVPKLMASNALMSFLSGIELSGSWLTPDMFDFGMMKRFCDMLRSQQGQE
jgi:hypothetical protein